jgi:hypothetical protein
MTDFLNFVSSSHSATSEDETVQSASECLDRFTEFFNACDTNGMDGELHFPHVMFSGSSRIEWLEAGQHPSDFFECLKASGWHHTRYESKEPVLVSQDKVHFVVTYSRRRSTEEVLSVHKNLWIVTRLNGRWGICVRSY